MFDKVFARSKMGCWVKCSDIALGLCSLKGKSPLAASVLFCFKPFLMQLQPVFLLLIGTSWKDDSQIGRAKKISEWNL